MTTQDLAEIERARYRCAVCNTGRHWRRFEVVRLEGREPAVLCAACSARYRAHPPEPPAPPAAPPTDASPEAAPTAASGAETSERSPRRRSRPARGRPHEDRLKKALRELPAGEHSTGRIAKAAGLNHAKTLSRLHALEAAGEIRQVGKRWSNERPSTDIEAALDRLQARTSNLRIVRPGERRD